MHLDDTWISPFLLAIEQSCDFNLCIAEKVPSTLVLKGDSASTLKLFQTFFSTQKSHEGSTQTKPCTRDYKDMKCILFRKTWKVLFKIKKQKHIFSHSSIAIYPSR